MEDIGGGGGGGGGGGNDDNDDDGNNLWLYTKRMWRMVAVMRRNLQNMRKSPRVADENMFGDGNGAELAIFAGNIDRRRPGWNGISVIYSIVRAPFSVLSCFSHPHINGADGVWASGELARISEMNHLMVSDSMRYAILM
ncbi:hypothetical protein F0562_011223 [Nyssa sinensis]|uniref:Uncharacterized protein n=1 Tax=Nyssa sinensis TaxID=561372 RepID=A0A5J5A2Y3_9ASTE|nr:hypothetical protein F0562_011223 [Nyssa sinensis]